LVAGGASPRRNPLKPRDRVHSGGPEMIVRVLLSALLAMGSVCAQSTSGSITGTVTDPSGAGVPKAKVTRRNSGNNAERQVLTDIEGLYRLPNLDPGEYVIEVDASGFRRASAPVARLETAGVLRVDFSLEVGQVADSVTVSTPAIEVNTQDP